MILFFTFIYHISYICSYSICMATVLIRYRHNTTPCKPKRAQLCGTVYLPLSVASGQWRIAISIRCTSHVAVQCCGALVSTGRVHKTSCMSVASGHHGPCRCTSLTFQLSASVRQLRRPVHRAQQLGLVRVHTPRHVRIRCQAELSPHNSTCSAPRDQISSARGTPAGPHRGSHLPARPLPG